jgi:hypothetical protein
MPAKHFCEEGEIMGDETRVQMREMQKGAEALGGIVERYMIRFLGPVGKRLSQSTKAGRLMGLIGVVGVLVSLVFFIFTDALRIATFPSRGHDYIRMTMREDYTYVLLGGIALLIIGMMQKKTR